jgi:hypothetical protein
MSTTFLIASVAHGVQELTQDGAQDLAKYYQEHGMTEVEWDLDTLTETEFCALVVDDESEQYQDIMANYGVNA